MALAPDADEAATPAKSGPNQRRRGRRFGLGLLAAIVAAAGIGYVLVTFAPDYIARYLVRTYVQGLAVDTAGVETIDIDPIGGEIKFGPVTFQGAGGEAGQVGQIAIRFDLKRLLTRQALVSSAAIEGIRIDIRQAADGAISINGIPLTQILAEQAAKAEAEAAKEPPPPPAAGSAPQTTVDGKLGWGAGLDRLQLRDSRVVFTKATGGEATIEVNQLDLEGFATWAPHDPGRFRLDGSLNRIGIVIDGTATPFADSVEIVAKTAITGIELGKVEQFAGPLGFDPSRGQVDVEVDGRGTVDVVSGRIDTVVTGTAALSGLDMANPGFGSLKLDTGSVRLDAVRFIADPSGQVDVSGNAAIDIGTMALRLVDGTAVGIGSGAIQLPALTTVVVPGAAPTIKTTPQVDIKALSLDGPAIQGRIATAAVRLSGIDVDPFADGTPTTLSGTAEVTGVDLTIPDAEPLRITADRAAAAMDRLLLAFPAGGTRIEGGVGIDATNPLLSIGGRPPRPGAVAPPTTIAAAGVAGQLPQLRITSGAPGTFIKVVSPALAADRFRLRVPLEPGTEFDLSGTAAAFRTVDLDVAVTQTLSVAGRAGVTAPSVALALRSADPAAAISGTADRLGIDIGRFSYRQAGNGNALGLGGRIEGERLAARFGGGTPAAKAVELTEVDLALDGLDYELGKPDPQQQLRASLALKSAEAVLPGGPMPLTASVRDVRLGDLAVDLAAPGRYGFERLALGKLDVALTRRATKPEAKPAAAAAPPAASRAGGDAASTPPRRSWPPEGLPVIRIGQFGLTEAATISLLDQSLSPPATATLLIDTLSLQNVDSTRPAQRSDVRLRARLGDGRIAADGWAQPFAARPDFELRAAIDDLRMPQLTPYAGPAIGLDITDGRLHAAADGKATAGRLKGELTATVAGLRFADRPEAGGDRLSRSVGLPLSTVIGLLEDADGTIAITLPMEGDLLSPSFDYSEMMWSATLRVLRALVVSPFKLVAASATLIAGGDGGGSGGAVAAAAAASTPGLPPLPFAAGESAVAGETQRAIVGLRQVLKNRPRMGLSQCAVVTAADAQRLIEGVDERERAAALTRARPQLQGLAMARMRAVEEAVTAGGSVDRGRLRRCGEPRIDPADPGPPRVEIGL